MHTVSGLFHSPSGVLFTFPSRYFCTIGHPFVFSLGGWSPLLQTGFHVSHPTLDPSSYTRSFLQACHLLWRGFPSRFSHRSYTKWRSATPLARFGLFPVRSPLLRESRLFSFPLVTKMFQFTRLASSGLCVQPVDSQIALRGFSHSES